MMRFSWVLAAGALLAACEQRAAEPAAEASQAEAQAPAADPNEPPLVRTAADPQLQWGECPPGLPPGCEIAVLHGDPAKPNADVFLRLPGGSAIAPHTHTSAERMILVTGSMEVQYKGTPAELLRAGSYAYGPAKRPHQASCRSSEPCTLFIAFEGPVDLIAFQGTLD